MSNCEQTVILPSAAPYRQPMAVIFTVVAVVSTTLNLAILLLFCRLRKLQSTGDKFLLMLCFSSLLVGLISAPATAAELLVEAQNCIVSRVANSFRALVAVNGVTVCVISYDRYLFITKIWTYREYMTTTRANWLMAAPWLTAASMAITRYLPQPVHMVWLMTLFPIVYTIHICSYYKLICKVLTQQQSMSRLQHAPVKPSTRKGKRTSRLVFWIAAVHGATTLPLFCYRTLVLIAYYKPEEFSWLRDNQGLIWTLAMLVYQMNSCINPVIYFREVELLKNACFKIASRSKRTRHRVSPQGQPKRHRTNLSVTGPS